MPPFLQGGISFIGWAWGALWAHPPTGSACPPLTPGQTYQIQIGRPSATSDGVGAPGSDVYIATPTNGSRTSPIQFKPNAALGSPAISSSTGNGNYAATWLNSTIAGLTGNATLGTLTVTIPANAPSSAAYAIHFDHVSASPNGIASFPNQTLTGLILLSDRSTSLFSPVWTPISTNTGSGADMEFHDTTGGKVRFYRVHVTP
jgi:hypothetical protein